MARLIPYEDVTIDIYPPYDHIRLIYLNLTGIRCPKCKTLYSRKEIGQFDPHEDTLVCSQCQYSSKLAGWNVKVSLCN